MKGVSILACLIKIQRAVRLYVCYVTMKCREAVHMAIHPRLGAVSLGLPADVFTAGIALVVDYSYPILETVCFHIPLNILVNNRETAPLLL